MGFLTGLRNAWVLKFSLKNSRLLSFSFSFNFFSTVPKYEGRPINKLQNGVFLLIFKISKTLNTRFVGNLFLYSHRNFCNSDFIIMMPLVLKAQSPCEIFPHCCHNSEVQTCIWPSWCYCHSLSLASVKSRLVLSFWYRLTWVVSEKGPLNVCVCVCVLPQHY